MVIQGQENGIEERQEDMHLNGGKYLCLSKERMFFLCAKSPNRKKSEGTDRVNRMCSRSSLKGQTSLFGIFWRGKAKSKILFTLTTYHFSSAMVVTRVFEVCRFKRWKFREKR